MFQEPGTCQTFCPNDSRVWRFTSDCYKRFLLKTHNGFFFKIRLYQPSPIQAPVYYLLLQNVALIYLVHQVRKSGELAKLGRWLWWCQTIRFIIGRSDFNGGSRDTCRSMKSVHARRHVNTVTSWDPSFRTIQSLYFEFRTSPHWNFAQPFKGSSQPHELWRCALTLGKAA